jgi:hypothetical protein
MVSSMAATYGSFRSYYLKATWAMSQARLVLKLAGRSDRWRANIVFDLVNRRQ